MPKRSDSGPTETTAEEPYPKRSDPGDHNWLNDPGPTELTEEGAFAFFKDAGVVPADVVDPAIRKKYAEYLEKHKDKK